METKKQEEHIKKILRAKDEDKMKIIIDVCSEYLDELTKTLMPVNNYLEPIVAASLGTLKKDMMKNMDNEQRKAEEKIERILGLVTLVTVETRESEINIKEP